MCVYLYIHKYTEDNSHILHKKTFILYAINRLTALIYIYSTYINIYMRNQPIVIKNKKQQHKTKSYKEFISSMFIFFGGGGGGVGLPLA